MPSETTNTRVKNHAAKVNTRTLFLQLVEFTYENCWLRYALSVDFCCGYVNWCILWGCHRPMTSIITVHVLLGGTGKQGCSQTQARPGSAQTDHKNYPGSLSSPNSGSSSFLLRCPYMALGIVLIEEKLPATGLLETLCTKSISASISVRWLDSQCTIWRTNYSESVLSR